MIVFFQGEKKFVLKEYRLWDKGKVKPRISPFPKSK